MLFSTFAWQKPGLLLAFCLASSGKVLFFSILQTKFFLFFAMVERQRLHKRAKWNIPSPENGRDLQEEMENFLTFISEKF